MARLRYCTLCGRMVEARKGFNWLAFLFLAGVFYLPIYLLKRRRCPICGAKKRLLMKAPVNEAT